MKSNILNRMNYFYCFIIVCSLYNTIQYFVSVGDIDIKTMIVPVIGNGILLFFCLIHWILVKCFPPKVVKIMDWTFISINGILIILGIILELYNLFLIWIIWTLGLLGFFR